MIISEGREKYSTIWKFIYPWLELYGYYSTSMNVIIPVVVVILHFPLIEMVLFLLLSDITVSHIIW